VPSTDFLRAAARRARHATLLAALALAACHSPMPPDANYPSRPPVTAIPAPAPVVPRGRPAQSADEYKMQIASRLVALNPSITYTTPAENPLLAIPILEIEVNADGSVRNIVVTRRPTDEDAQDTIQIAIDAVRRSAPFGDARHVPHPWKFTEVFLFDHERRFKPRVLD
jgi:hypothetical protein